MISLQVAALSGNHPSVLITEVLGVVAVCAFFAIACCIGFQALRSSCRRLGPKDAGALVRGAESEGSLGRALQRKAPEIDATQDMEAEYEKRYCKLLELARPKLGELTRTAEKCFERIAASYAGNSYSPDAENRDVRAKRFASVCEHQWGFMRSEIGYLSYLDIQEHLRHILDNHRLLDSHKASVESETGNLHPDLLRSQEMVALARVVSRERVSSLQGDLLDAVRDFGTSYEKEAKTWVNDQIVMLSKEIRKRRPGGISLSDTEYFDKYKQLRTRLEIVARLADRIVQNTQQIGEASVALSQVIYVGTVLRVLTSVPEWFSELELSSAAEAEAKPGARAGV